jgi:hypothetical protein
VMRSNNPSNALRILKAFPNMHDLLDPFGAGEYIFSKCCQKFRGGFGSEATDWTNVINWMIDNGFKPNISHAWLLTRQDDGAIDMR